MEMLSHAENIAQIPVNGRCPRCYKVAVTADVHLRRSCGDDVEVNYKYKRIARVNGALYAVYEHDRGIVGERVYRQRGLHDDQRQRILMVVVIGGVLAQITDRAAAYADDDILALEVSLDLGCVFGRCVNYAVRLADDQPLDIILRVKICLNRFLNVFPVHIDDLGRACYHQHLFAVGKALHGLADLFGTPVLDVDLLHTDAAQLIGILLRLEYFSQLIKLCCVGFN